MNKPFQELACRFCNVLYYKLIHYKRLNSYSIIGICSQCCNTGIMPVPFSEIL